MKWKLIIALVILLVVVNSVYFFGLRQINTLDSSSSEGGTSAPSESTNPSDSGSDNNWEDTPSTPTAPSTPSETQPTGISASELAQHTARDDCWVVFEGNVYDVTAYLPRHPGGVSRIQNTCGDPTAFETAFLKKHGRSKVSLLKSVSTLKGEFSG